MYFADSYHKALSRYSHTMHAAVRQLGRHTPAYEYGARGIIFAFAMADIRLHSRAFTRT